MNIDKFGHHVHKRLRLSNILDYDEKKIFITEEGDFDLQQKRLKGVKYPILADEVVNKEYVDEIINKYYTKQEVDNLILSVIKRELISFRDQLPFEFSTKKDLEKIIKVLKNDKRSNSERNS